MSGLACDAEGFSDLGPCPPVLESARHGGPFQAVGLAAQGDHCR